jgi:AcrR family transcriptional regulator
MERSGDEMMDKQPKESRNAGKSVPKVDKRIQKTKRALTESLTHLIIERGYEAVTVQDILDHALVGRSTFYAHYENKEQLFLDGFKNLNVALFAPVDSVVGGPLLPLFIHANEHRTLAKALLGKKSGEIFIESTRLRIADHLKQFTQQKNKTKEHSQLWVWRCHMAAGAALVLLRSWLEDESTIPVEKVSREAWRVTQAILEIRRL